MIHAENGDMIEWLTGKCFCVDLLLTFLTISLSTDKLEAKGMVGECTYIDLTFQVLMLLFSSILPRPFSPSTC